MRQDMSEPNKTHYLAFVDGLRAISILAVVGFHLGLPGFSGGFVGVDAFFVISGFLIINQIKTGLENGRFSIASFYVRRSLRILPPFFVVLLTVYVLALMVLPTPGVYFDYMLSALLSPLMVSNVLFFFRQGYFDIAADQKPLLHTWTLSVEEQFYFVAPLLLVLVFHLGRRRFGAIAMLVGIILAALSLAGAIAETYLSGRNAAFYLPHWRAWEFVVGGFIVGPTIVALRRAPRWAAEVIGCAGLAAIVVAIVIFDAKSAYPSYRAVVPVAGAALIILSGLAQPHILIARMLALRWFVGIGLVSYGWYLWHWPILSFIRIARLGEPTLAALLGGAALAYLLACLSYRYLEQPIRKWRSRGGVKRPVHFVAGAVAACFATAALGGLSGLAGYLSTKSFVASRYGTDGKGVLDNGCRALTSSSLPNYCFEGKLGMIVGDSHADALFGSFARRFDEQGIRLISIARGGCSPILFAPSRRDRHRRDPCANLFGPFERVLAMPTPVAAVVITSAWPSSDLLSVANLSELVAQFDSSRTHILMLAPVPIFFDSGLDCVVLSDRNGESRERCGRPRSAVEAERALAVQTLKTAAERFANVRYIDPIDLFCDARTCRPFDGDQVFYRDGGHVLPSGADRIYEAFENDFRWLTRE
jgi:peptidoglycan/LPS O-acetylase OafA/YrhL